MEYQFILGTKFTTACDLDFRGFEIPKGTVFEINEILGNGDYKICFTCNDQENPECIQILNSVEIKNIIAENLIMLVEEADVDIYQPIKTNANHQQLQLFIKEYKRTADFEEFNVKDVRKLILSKGYTCEIIDMPNVYY